MPRFAALVAVFVVVAACGGDGDAATTTAVPSSTAAATSSTVAATSSSTTTTTSTTSTTTPAEPSVGVELLISGPSGVTLMAPDGTARLVVSSPAVFAIDDLNGGVLFQQERWAREGQSVVYRVAGDGTEAIKTLIPTSEQGLVLNGAVDVDDDTYIYYSRIEGQTPDDARMTLRRYNLASREVTELSEVGGWESASFPISISESLILYNWSAEAYSGMDFTDLTGNEAAVAADPDPDGQGFFDCGPCPRLGELSSNADRIAYVERRDGIRYVVIKHVASGAEVQLIELPEAQWTPLSLDLSTTHLVVNRRNGDSVLDAWVYDLQQVNPDPVAVGIAGEAYMTLAPVTVQGPVPAP